MPTSLSVPKAAHSDDDSQHVERRVEQFDGGASQRARFPWSQFLALVFKACGAFILITTIPMPVPRTDTPVNNTHVEVLDLFNRTPVHPAPGSNATSVLTAEYRPSVFDHMLTWGQRSETAGEPLVDLRNYTQLTEAPVAEDGPTEPLIDFKNHTPVVGGVTLENGEDVVAAEVASMTHRSLGADADATSGCAFQALIDFKNHTPVAGNATVTVDGMGDADFINNTVFNADAISIDQSDLIDTKNHTPTIGHAAVVIEDRQV